MAGILAGLRMVQGNLAKTAFGLPGSRQSVSPLKKHHQMAVRSNWKHAQHRSGSTSAKKAPWRLFEKSIDFELQTGCENFQGRELAFSEYAQKATSAFNLPSSLQSDFDRFVDDLGKYPTLKIEQREKVLQSGLSLISKWAELEKRIIDVSKVQAPSSSDRNRPDTTPDPPVEAKQQGPVQQVLPGSTQLISGSSNKVSTSGASGMSEVWITPPVKKEPKRKRRIESTAEQRQMFAEAANKRDDPLKWEKVGSAEQRSSEWMEGRKERLTASAFAKVLGLHDQFEPDSVQHLWEEKLGFREPFKGNERTEWGTAMEPVALEEYKKISGATVEEHGLKLLVEDEAHQWLAGSPDGIITPNKAIPDLFDLIPSSVVGKGLLEIKCPYGNDPQMARPRMVLQEYYYPQVQGLMDVFDLEWCHLMSWTKHNGVTVFWIPRNRPYWAKAYRLLAEFWWENVVPAKLKIAEEMRKNSGDLDLKSPAECAQPFRPKERDPRREAIKEDTKQIVAGLKWISRGAPENVQSQWS